MEVLIVYVEKVRLWGEGVFLDGALHLFGVFLRLGQWHFFLGRLRVEGSF